jgi:hypothetical protein
MKSDHLYFLFFRISLPMGSSSYCLVGDFRGCFGLRAVITSNLALWFYYSAEEKSRSGKVQIDVVRTGGCRATVVWP